MHWLERRANRECPCCRESMVSDDAVWKMVRRLRRERRKVLRLENGLTHRLVRCILGKKYRGDNAEDDIGGPSMETEEDLSEDNERSEDIIDMEDGRLQGESSDVGLENQVYDVTPTESELGTADVVWRACE
jgi:hypothetical protein